MAEDPAPDGVHARLDAIFRAERGRILATLIAILRDFELAEEALADAVSAALTTWARQGVPQNPRAWLVAAAKNRAIDRLRRDATLARTLAALPAPDRTQSIETLLAASGPLADDRLRLLFTCCHPALAVEAQIALALHTLCGLTTEEIARAFLVTPTTLAQRLVRAKRKIRAAGVPYRVPEEAELGERLVGVLRTIYLVFNEGYAASGGERLLRVDLSREAIRLARLVVALLPGRSEAVGLLALQLLVDARREARVDGNGDLVRLSEQDRSRWDPAQLREGLGMAEEALRLAREPASFALQAAIAAEHARAARAEDTDWSAIVALYDRLAACEPSPVVTLNRAVAVAEARGPEHALPLVDALVREGALDRYHLLHVARGELLARLGRGAEAAVRSNTRPRSRRRRRSGASWRRGSRSSARTAHDGCLRVGRHAFSRGASAPLRASGARPGRRARDRPIRRRGGPPTGSRPAARRARAARAFRGARRRPSARARGPRRGTRSRARRRPRPRRPRPSRSSRLRPASRCAGRARVRSGGRPPRSTARRPRSSQARRPQNEDGRSHGARARARAPTPAGPSRAGCCRPQRRALG
jgi:RNA polymerase sigma-70 factor (ECF subfamily)